MKKLITFLLLFFSITFVNALETVPTAEIHAKDVPDELFGSWRVISKLDSTNSYLTFKPQSADIWNISKNGDAIILENFYTGAKAEVSVKAVEGSLVVFSKINPYDNKIYTDTIRIRLGKGSFTGINTAVLESFSLIDNHLLKTEIARYHIKGEKI